MKLVHVAEMVEIERAADASGLSYSQMIQNAGRGLADVISESCSDRKQEGILALVGKGNNGGDSLVALTWLAKEGWEAQAYMVGDRSRKDPLLHEAKSAGVIIALQSEDTEYDYLQAQLFSCGVLMDGLLGTGVRLPLRDPFPDLLQVINNYLNELDAKPIIIAVDCPSGIDCETGEAAPNCLSADLTACMAAIKRGMLKLPAFGFLGDLLLVNIGLKDDLEPWQAIKHRVVDSGWVGDVLPERPLNAHKGTFGTALIVAGSRNYPGAALLAGKAAYRVGAGLVSLAVPGPLKNTLPGHLPEATWISLPHVDGAIAQDGVQVLGQNLDRVTAILVGPGLGLADTTKMFVESFLKLKNPGKLPALVVDADGLNLLSGLPNWPELLPPESVLTPHPGEMSVLTGLAKEEIQQSRIETAQSFAKQWGHVVVLKGAFTVVASPTGQTATLPVATPALARAGTGDVLAGMIVGLRAQGLNAYDAAVAGAWLHAQSGISAAVRVGSTAGVMAGDLIEEIPQILNFLGK